MITLSNEIGGVWRTVGGRRIFIKDGQDLATAMKESGKFDKNNDNYKILSENDIKNLQKSSDECYNKLTPDEKEAMYEYCMGGYQDVNDYLNGKFNGYENTKDFITQIDNAMSKYELKENIIAFRGVNGEHYDNYNVGDIFEEKMYYSTSLNKNIAQTFSDDKINSTMLEINVPKGTKSIYIGSNTEYDFEAELLLGRNLKYKVIGKSEGYIKLEVFNEKRK